MSPRTPVASTVAVERLDQLARERGIELSADRPLAPLTTLRVGGPAQRYLEVTERAGLLDALRLARAAGVPAFVLGNGSDLVVSDDGMPGLVIRNRARDVDVRDTTLTADAGAPMALLVKRCTGAGLAGLEFGISIPGTLGGAVWANAGAHGGEIKDVLVSADAWDPATDGELTLANADCAFDYRESRFKHGDEVVLSATLQLEHGEPDAIGERVDANQAQRRATQPLADQNAGSVFRNPPGDHAGRLIDVAGLKGHRVGSAEVSRLHANFIVVDRGGRAADVRALGEEVRARVAERFGVTLEYEIEFVGTWPEPPEPAGEADA